MITIWENNEEQEVRETEIEELMEIIKAPDFPTGATIYGTYGIEQAYRTGKGKVKVKAKAEIEEMHAGKSQNCCNRNTLYG